NKENAMGRSSGKEKVVSFASMLQNRPAKKIVKVTELRNSEQVQGAAVAIPLEAVKEGKSDYARALIEVAADKELLNSVVVAIRFLDETGHSLETAKEVNDGNSKHVNQEQKVPKPKEVAVKNSFEVLSERMLQAGVIELEKPYGTDGTSTNPEEASTPIDEVLDV
ncbi:hypothetical protein Tco_1581102, partial [Tanacetum coccineum]